MVYPGQRETVESRKIFAKKRVECRLVATRDSAGQLTINIDLGNGFVQCNVSLQELQLLESRRAQILRAANPPAHTG